GLGPARRRAVYLHEDRHERPLRGGKRRGREPGLVPGQLSEKLLPAGLYGRANARPSVADSRRCSLRMAKLPSFRLILASASVGRRELLAQAGYQFEIVPANIEEPTDVGFTGGGLTPRRSPPAEARALVQHIAWLKAAAVAPRISEG